MVSSNGEAGSSLKSWAHTKIGGGSGFVGRHLAPLLRTNGYFVQNISRMPGVDNIQWHEVATALPPNTHAVVNLAGQNFMDPTRRWSAGFKQNVVTSRVNTTKLLAKSINEAKEKPKVFVLITGVGAYPPSESKKYDENTPCEQSDFFSKLCAEWEGAAKVSPPCRLVIIRSGVVLGRDGGMVQNMILPFWFGVGGRLGDGRQYLPWIHVEDLCRLIHFAIKNDQVTGVLNGVAPQVITNEQFTKAFARALSRPALIPVPVPVLNCIFDKERAMVMTQGQHVTPKRVQEFGFQYKYHNIDDACKEFAYLWPKKSAKINSV